MAGRPRAEQTKRREMQLLEMRNARVPWETIATELKFKNEATARATWHRVMNRNLAEGVEETRDEIRAVIHGLLATYYPQARKGSIQAAKMCDRLLDRWAKVDGAYSPVKTELSGAVQFETSEFEEVVTEFRDWALSDEKVVQFEEYKKQQEAS